MQNQKIDRICINCMGCNQQELPNFKEKTNCKNFIYGGKDYGKEKLQICNTNKITFT